MESARKEKEEYERQLEEERQEAMARDRQKMEEKVAEEKKFKDMLKEQMLELKAREVEVGRTFKILIFFHCHLVKLMTNGWQKR